MTSPAHDRHPTSHADDETPTQFDSSFAEDAADALRVEHWTSEARAADTSIDSALARFEQASMAFAVVARAARASAPEMPTKADTPPGVALDSGEPATTTAAAPVADAATPVADVATSQPVAPAAVEAAVTPAMPRAEPARVLPLKPTPQAGRVLAPTEMIVRAFEDTTPDFPAEVGAHAAPGAPAVVAAPAGRAGSRLALWLTIGIAALVAAGALLLAARVSTRPAPTSQAIARPAVATIAPTPMPATPGAQAPVPAPAPVQADAASAPVADAAAPPATATPATPAVRPATVAAAKASSPVDVGAAIANAQSKSDRFLAGDASSTSTDGPDVKAGAAR